MGYQNASDFGQISKKDIQHSSTFHDYQKKLEPALRKLAEQICSEKLYIAMDKAKLVVAFDAGWSHRRNANQCIGILLDLLTGYIISFHIAHHSPEQNDTLTSTTKHSKCMEKICLEKILNRIDITNVNSCTFVHDRDISADYLVKKIWP